MSVGIIYDPIYLSHDTGEHPENAGRLEAITSQLQSTGTWAELSHIAPRPATVDELKWAHSESLIQLVKETAERGGGMLDPDTVVSPASYEAALYAAGGLIKAVEAVMSEQVSSAFALVRPPGHHASRDRAMGFCLFNNIAVAASYALNKLNLSRVLILDWDVHHGNGTQNIFQYEPRLNYISSHQSPHYPGSGMASDTGVGNITNIPLPAGCGDAEYLGIMDEIVAPTIRLFRPKLIMVSAGFDGHWADPLASMKLSTSGYARIMRRTLELANELCRGRLVITLEGGYNLPALAGSVQAVFNALLGKSDAQDTLGPPPALAPPDIEPLIRRVKEIHRL